MIIGFFMLSEFCACVCRVLHACLLCSFSLVSSVPVFPVILTFSMSTTFLVFSEFTVSSVFLVFVTSVYQLFSLCLLVSSVCFAVFMHSVW